MKKLLYISHLYPPVGGSGVQRSLKFAKLLPASGWEPIMLVADARFLNQPKDTSLKRDIPSGQLIYSSFSPDIRWLYKLLWGLKLNIIVNFINRYLMVPDADVLWLPFAKHTIKKVLQQHKIDMLLITAPPYSALLLGLYVKKKYGIDFCVDFRDMWSLGVGKADNPPPKWIKEYENKLEKCILQQAAKVIVVNNKMRETLLLHYPMLSKDKVMSITNGYDEEDFHNSPVHTPSSILHIVFTGSLYGRFQPDIVWKALVSLNNEAAINMDEIRFDFYGKNNAAFILGEYSGHKVIRSCVHIHSYLSHKDSISKICRADALLLLSPPGKGADMDSHSKLFEYMRSGRTILAIIPPQSAGAQILAPCGTAIIADSSNDDAVKKAILQLYIDWKSGSLNPMPDYKYISQFERKELTGKLAQFLDTSP